jgi:hypothetical protein
MANRRSRRNKQYFFCPYCQKRLWRNGSPKYYLYYAGKTEIQKGFGLSAKNATFLVNQSFTQLDQGVWLEEFFCEKDGRIWFHISRKEDKLNSRLATAEDWNRSTKTINPDGSNGTVSEFTNKISRGCNLTLLNRMRN